MLKRKNRKNLFALEEVKLHKDLDFVALEQYKLLRTNLLFTVKEDIKCPVIGISSSISGESKSTTAINLAYVIAENGGKVLLIDGDLRLPTIAKKMQIKSIPGLSDLLVNHNLEIKDWKSPINNNWYIIPSGEIPPNPSELLSSNRMKKLLEKLKESFDYIIIDLPPVNAVSDSMSIAPFLDGMILVVKEDYCTKKDLEQCMKQIRLSKVNLLGCVVRYSDKKENFYGKNKKYRSYGYI